MSRILIKYFSFIFLVGCVSNPNVLYNCETKSSFVVGLEQELTSKTLPVCQDYKLSLPNRSVGTVNVVLKIADNTFCYRSDGVNIYLSSFQVNGLCSDFKSTIKYDVSTILPQGYGLGLNAASKGFALLKITTTLLERNDGR